MKIQLSKIAVNRIGNRIHIQWNKDEALGKVKVFIGLSPLDTKVQLAETGVGISSLSFDDPNPGLRTYYVLKSEHGGTRLAAERRLPLEGSVNFRDMGGYETVDGRYIKWGLLYRSEELIGLTESDRRYLQNCGLKLICDYRAEYEAELKPNPSIGNARQIGIPIEVESSRHRSRMNYMDMIDKNMLHLLGPSGEMLTLANQRYVSDFAKSFTTLFNLLLTPGNLPMVQHCAAGKDRTGFGSAILLLALGVSKQTIMEDYLLTNTLREETDRKILASIRPKLTNDEDWDVLWAMMQARQEYLQAAFDEIQLRYGSIELYLEVAVGLTPIHRKQLQDMLLTDI
ncbi:protein-tyrosine-phosphatase [Paenibacillus sp. LMG 31456]|uniref:Protein-tyrosine-phosphatase n=1 Tax=Paenibacillus foliorum TaxID=2654974 RepID=A0A972GP81_9BACL|nr:tyrosine-protein phosphatase [Paenibacillus foliorum]NOU94324.1 protein-tyrosine-phosphatase [Paenibacillus foliorum]